MALLSFGTRLGESLAAAEKLGAFGLTPTIADARFSSRLGRVVSGSKRLRTPSVEPRPRPSAIISTQSAWNLRANSPVVTRAPTGPLPHRPPHHPTP